MTRHAAVPLSVYRRWRSILGIGLFTLPLGCSHGPSAMDAGRPDQLPSLEEDLRQSEGIVAEGGLACPTDKIAFSQAQGCLNDGSVEFCLPAPDQVLRQRVMEIDPGIHCSGGGGRARCDPQTEVLCFLPTSGPATCVSAHGSMTDEAWRTVCEIAAFPEVRRVVPTFFE